jgi:hypothetical protein
MRAHCALAFRVDARTPLYIEQHLFWPRFASIDLRLRNVVGRTLLPYADSSLAREPEVPNFGLTLIGGYAVGIFV